MLASARERDRRWTTRASSTMGGGSARRLALRNRGRRDPRSVCGRLSLLEARELLTDGPQFGLIRVLGDDATKLRRRTIELAQALVSRRESQPILDGVHAVGVLRERTLEGGRGLGMVTEREVAARHAHRQLVAEVEECVERRAALGRRRAFQPLEDGERGGGLPVPRIVPGVLEVDDVGEVAVRILAAQLLEGVACGVELVLFEQAARGEVLIDVAELRIAGLSERAEGLG